MTASEAWVGSWGLGSWGQALFHLQGGKLAPSNKCRHWGKMPIHFLKFLNHRLITLLNLKPDERAERPSTRNLLLAFESSNLWNDACPLLAPLNLKPDERAERLSTQNLLLAFESSNLWNDACPLLALSNLWNDACPLLAAPLSFLWPLWLVPLPWRHPFWLSPGKLCHYCICSWPAMRSGRFE